MKNGRCKSLRRRTFRNIRPLSYDFFFFAKSFLFTEKREKQFFNCVTIYRVDVDLQNGVDLQDCVDLRDDADLRKVQTQSEFTRKIFV